MQANKNEVRHSAILPILNLVFSAVDVMMCQNTQASFLLPTNYLTEHTNLRNNDGPLWNKPAKYTAQCQSVAQSLLL